VTWLKPLNPRGEASAGDNNDTQAAWLSVMQGEASPGLIAEARKAFARHLGDISLSLAGYHAITYRLPDGSTMRVVSNSGIHQVQLWPLQDQPKTELPHGFAVVTNWATPRIFKRRTLPTVSWATDPRQVPQVKTDIEGENHVFRARGAASYFAHPMVLTDTTPLRLWDYAPRGIAGALSSANPVVPICLQVGSNYTTANVHYGIDNVIYGPDGTALYTMALSDPILLSPENPVHAPAATTAAGTEALLQHIRLATTSPTFGIYTARFANERLARLSETSYSLAERNVVSITGPIGASAPPSGSTSSTLGESTDSSNVDLKITYLGAGGAGGSIGWTDGLGPISYKTRVVYDQDLPVPDGSLTVSETATREEGTFTAAATTVEFKTIALPAETTAIYPQLQIDTSATGSVYWRAGQVEVGVPDPSTTLGTSLWYGIAQIRKFRIDTQYSRETSPRIQYVLGWADLKLLEGNTTGECDGRTHVNTTASAHTLASTASSEFEYTFAGDAPGVTSTRAEWVALAAPLDIGPAVRAAITAFPRGSLPIWGTPATVADERPINTGSYTLTSRYVVDFDHKGQFYAAVKVVVNCAGAEWRDSAGAYLGDMVEHAQPEYTVTIYLETNWKGAAASTLLTTATATRPAFEFQEIVKQNPYYFLTGEPDKQEMIVRMPPSFGLPIEAMTQIKTICSHQGTSPAIVCADVRPDITGDAAAKAQSTTGIEFSTIERGRLTPHDRYVTGQLYARSFKLSDFPDALWLLKATKCDAKEDDGSTGSSYFYMPDLVAALAADRHVEVRDGVHETWSDEFMPGPDQPADPLDRDIKLYRV